MDFKKLQSDIDNEYDIENLQRQLAGVDIDIARQVVVSMDDQKVYTNVNMRKFQSDYICDYLAFLWDISKKDFWRHVKASFDVSEGLLWGDNMIHCQKMIEGRIPNYIWTALVHFALNVSDQQDIDALGCIIKAQTAKFRKPRQIYDLIQQLPEPEQKPAKNRIEYMLRSTCQYNFD